MKASIGAICEKKILQILKKSLKASLKFFFFRKKKKELKSIDCSGKFIVTHQNDYSIHGHFENSQAEICLWKYNGKWSISSVNDEPLILHKNHSQWGMRANVNYHNAVVMEIVRSKQRGTHTVSKWDREESSRRELSF